MQTVLHPKGKFKVTCKDKDGNLKWENEFPNGVTDAALNLLLNVMLGATAKSSAWYLGLIDNTNPTLSASDTMAVHSWTENVGYSSATRPQWTPLTAATAKVITNSTAIAFTITVAGTIYGFFCVDNSTKGGTTGNLWATAAFAGGPQAVSIGDVLNVTYSVSAA